MVVVEAVVVVGCVKQSSITETVGREPGMGTGAEPRPCGGAEGGGRWWPWVCRWRVGNG